MSRIQQVRLADCAFVPWRNGGGRTRELLAWPTAEDWLVRVSVAEIEADGPFSAFDGIERCFAVLEGAGLRLALPQGEVRLAVGDAAIGFAGEAAPMCRLIDGPTRDLNLMARRQAGRPRLSCTRADDSGWRWRGLFSADTLFWTDQHDTAWPPPYGGWWLGLEPT
jgi:environmental stress-induced protein Ves